MRRVAPSSPPPRFAAWLVDVFAPAEHAEAILGDLHEEFSDIVGKSKTVLARRWYWRQSVTTVFHLARAGLRAAPWALAGVAILGVLLRWLSTALLTRGLIAIARAQQHYDLYIRLLTSGMPLIRAVQMALIGCIVAAIAKGREIVATMLLITVSVMVFGFVLPLWMRNLSLQMSIPWIFQLRNFEDSMAILLGGIGIREIRSASLRRHPTP